LVGNTEIRGNLPMATFRYIVTDVDQALEFYTTHLGFTIDGNFAPAMAIILRDDIRLLVAGPKASSGRPMPNGDQPVPGGWNRIVLPFDDLAATVEKLQGDGVEFLNDIEVGPGGSQILCVDPSGNPIELFQPE
jgi:catechol 2,3-dioxygenase-like lactoylglutathione lyase family enzyme